MAGKLIRLLSVLFHVALYAPDWKDVVIWKV